MNYHHSSFFILHPSSASCRARLSHPSTRSTRRTLFTRRQHPHFNFNSQLQLSPTLILQGFQPFFNFNSQLQLLHKSATTRLTSDLKI